jgi:hypothetical protein
MITAEELLTEIKEDTTAPVEPQEKEEKDPRKVKQRTPPTNGLCRRCGQNKPINRLMLCYPCWVKVELEKSGWHEGEAHPDWCACEGIKDHPRESYGN